MQCDADLGDQTGQKIAANHMCQLVREHRAELGPDSSHASRKARARVAAASPASPASPARSSRGPRPFGCRTTRRAEAGSLRREDAVVDRTTSRAQARDRQNPEAQAGRSPNTGWRRTPPPAIPASSTATACCAARWDRQCTRELVQKGGRSMIATDRLLCSVSLRQRTAARRSPARYRRRGCCFRRSSSITVEALVEAGRRRVPPLAGAAIVHQTGQGPRTTTETIAMKNRRRPGRECARRRARSPEREVENSSNQGEHRRVSDASQEHQTEGVQLRFSF